MEVNRIIAEIDAQILKLQQARALLAGTTTSASRTGRGRPKGSKTAVAHSSARGNGASISIEDIQAVKALAEKLGAEKLRQLADVLA